MLVADLRAVVEQRDARRAPAVVPVEGRGLRLDERAGGAQRVFDGDVAILALPSGEADQGVECAIRREHA